MIICIDFSQEMLEINALTALKSSLTYPCKHFLRLLRLFGDQALDHGKTYTKMRTLTVWHVWSVGPIRPSDQSDAIMAGFLYMFLSIYISMSRRKVQTSFPQWSSRFL